MHQISISRWKLFSPSYHTLFSFSFSFLFYFICFLQVSPWWRFARSFKLRRARIDFCRGFGGLEGVLWFNSCHSRVNKTLTKCADALPLKQVDDLNDRFTFQPNQFDLVHSRLVASGINRSRWPSYIQDLVRQVKNHAFPPGSSFLFTYFSLCLSPRCKTLALICYHPTASQNQEAGSRW